MDFEKLSDRLKGFLQSAQCLANREGNPQITPEHLLKVLLDDPEGLGGGADYAGRRQPKKALERDRDRARQAAEGLAAAASQVYMAPATRRVLDDAEQIATKAGDSFVTVERAAAGAGLAKEAEAAAHPRRCRRHAADAQRRHQRSAQRPHGGQRRRRAGL